MIERIRDIVGFEVCMKFGIETFFSEWFSNYLVRESNQQELVFQFDELLLCAISNIIDFDIYIKILSWKYS